MENENKVEYGVNVKDGVVNVNVNAKIDIIEVLEDMSKNTSNKIDDYLVEMVKLAKNGLDWKGYAKEHIID